MKLKNSLENQKVALKLANKYADSFKLLQRENKALLQELNDNKINLQINKSMIEDLLSNMKPAQKEKSIIDGLKKEINNINNTLNFFIKENLEIKKGVANNGNNNEIIINKYQKQIDSLSNKLFLLENTIIKKENIIQQLNKKLDDTLYYKVLEGSVIFRETYLIDPQVTINLIHEDLLLYKHVYEKICVNFKDALSQNTNLETLVDNLRLENSKLVNLVKNIKSCGAKDQKSMLNEFYDNYKRDRVYENNYGNQNSQYYDEIKTSGITEKETNCSNNKNPKSINNLEEIQEQGELESDGDDSYIYNLYSPIAVNFPEKIICKKSHDDLKGIIPSLDLSKTKNINYKIPKKEEEKGKTPRITKKLANQNNEEWIVSLKYAGLKPEDIDRLSRNKLLVKIFDAMLNLNRIIEEKNCLLTNSIKKLRAVQGEKVKRERENINLYQKIISIRTEVENFMMKSNNSNNNNIKISNNEISIDKLNNSSKYVNTETSMNNNIETVENNEMKEDVNSSSNSNRTQVRLPNSERQRNILNDINDLHSSMIKEHEEIREYLQTEAFCK